MKSIMYEREALNCQDYVSSYPYVSQKMWPNKIDIGKWYFHHTQIPLNLECVMDLS